MDDQQQNDQSPQSGLPAGEAGTPPSPDEHSEAGQAFPDNKEQAKPGSDAQQAFPGDEDMTQSGSEEQQAFHEDHGLNAPSDADHHQTSFHTELEETRRKAEEYLNGWKRAQADYQNLKRDMEKEHVELAKFANLSLLLELLPILDNFRRAIQHLPEERKNDEWTKGVLAIHQQFQSVLNGMGVTEVPTGGTFNPQFHEAVGDGDGRDVPSGTILEVLQQGYLLHGKLIRPAKVRIAK